MSSAEHSTRHGREHTHDQAALITDAQDGTSKEFNARVRRYTITMAFRTACFISMIFVPSPWRWILFGCAVVLPYIAVVIANQANQRTKFSTVQRAEPIDRPQLTTGEEHEVISGTVEDADEEPELRHDDRRVA